MERYPVFIDCPYYSKLPTDSMRSTSKSQLHLSQKLEKKNPKMYMKSQKTQNSQNYFEKEK